MFVNGDVLYTELLNSGSTQYCFAFFLNCDTVQDK